MLRHPGYTRQRIAQVGDRIRALIHADALAPERLAVAGPVDRIEPAEAELLDYRDCELGETFGPLWASYWFKVEATVPERWQGERVDLLWVSHSEATLWDGGRALQGLNTSPDGARVDAMLREAAAAGERLDLRVELACNGLFGELPRPYASREPVVLDRCQIARFDPRAWRLHNDFDVLRRLEAEHANGLDPTWAGELLYELNRVCNVWSEHDPAPGTRPRRSWRPCSSAATPPSRTSCRRSATRTSTPPGCGRWPRATARRCAASARRLPTWTAIRSSGSRARRRSCTSASGHAWSPASGCRWAAPGWSPTATCRRASRSCASSCTASAISSGSSAAAVPSSGTPTCSATTASCRRSCAAPGSAGSSPRSCPGTGSTRPPTTPSPGRGSTGRRCSRTSRRPTRTTPRPRWPSSVATFATTRTTIAPTAACWCSATATAAVGRRRTCWRRYSARAICRAFRARPSPPAR